MWIVYLLMSNGASVVPLFFPGVPQGLLLLAVARRMRQLTVSIAAALPILVVSLALLILAIGSALHGIDDDAIKYLKLILNSVVALLCARSIQQFSPGEDFPAAYCRAISLMTLAGCLGLALALVSAWSLTASIGDRSYHTNMLTVWISDAGYDSSQALFSPFPFRLQAWFDEPGTYGVMLIPAMYYALLAERGRYVVILLVGVALSESANAWALTLALLIWKGLTAASRWLRLVIITALMVILALSAEILYTLYIVKTGIDDAYANSSSLSTRASEYGYVSEHWANHLLPLSNMQELSRFPEGISSSYVGWYIHGGIVFLVVMFFIGIAWLRLCISAIRYKDPTQSFAAILAFAMLLSGFQRTSALDNVLFMTLLYWALLCARRPAQS